MEAIGQLTGGVAHDFNNLLHVIIPNLDLLAKKVRGQQDRERLIAPAQKAAARGAQLTSCLPSLRRQTLRPESRPMNDLVREFDVLTSRMLGELVRIDFAQLDPSAGACDVDPAQFCSTLLNLVVNARDAMSSGGELRIRTASHSLSAQDAARYPDARRRATMSSCRSRIVASVCRRRSSSGR